MAPAFTAFMVVGAVIVAHRPGNAPWGRAADPEAAERGAAELGRGGATLAVAALFQPARRRVQAVVDRRFNRRK